MKTNTLQTINKTHNSQPALKFYPGLVAIMGTMKSHVQSK